MAHDGNTLEAALGEAVCRQLARLLAQPPAPGLHLVATPIGHLGDITLRALTLLATVDLIYCEDSRQTHKLLERYGLQRPLRPYHEHNAEAERPHIMGALEQGRSIALVSDAGTPLVSDPGFKLVREAAAAGHMVTAAPGPSAVLAGLTVSGLPTDSFHFGGFLPAKPGQRRERIEALRSIPATLVLFEAPQRLGASLEDLFEVLGDRPAALARELTKLHEETVRGRLGQLALRYRQAETKGECVILVGAGEASIATDEAISALLAEAMRNMSARDAAEIVARQLGVPRKRVYALAIAHPKAGGTEP